MLVMYSNAACDCWCSGQIGFLLCTKKSGEAVDPRIPKREPSAKLSQDYPPLRYAFLTNLMPTQLTVQWFAVTSMRLSGETALYLLHFAACVLAGSCHMQGTVHN